jgi:Fe-S cluster assembly scaffold protein SufB
MAEPVRFYLDEHVDHAVARGLAERGVDVLTASAARMLEASDVSQLEFATSQKRVVFSQDADFLRLHATGLEHAGIIYAPQQTSIGKLIQGLMLIFETMTPEQMRGHVEFL